MNYDQIINKSAENSTFDKYEKINTNFTTALKRNKQEEENNEDENDRGFVFELVELGKIIIVALFVALFINSFILTNSFIPTGSMESTIPVGGRTFGLRQIYNFVKPKRGDVVVFDFGYVCDGENCGRIYRKDNTRTCPYCGTPDDGKQKVYYVKRVIGLPGDHIEIKYEYDVSIDDMKKSEVVNSGARNIVKCGYVYVNGKKLDEPYLNDHMIVDDQFYPSVDIVVPDNCYYMLGDNRNNSEDARFWNNQHYVHNYEIISKVFFEYFPLNKMHFIK